MEFEIKGIKFNKSDLKDLELCELRIGSISRHHLFHSFGKDKFMLILRAGDYIDPGFVSKYLDKGVEKFSTIEVVSTNELIQFKNLFDKLKNSKTEREQKKFQIEFVELLKTNYNNGNQHSFLTPVIFLFEELYHFTDQILESYQQTSSILFARALRVSTVGVINCVLNNYLDWKYLKDFYNICFIMDYGLVEYGQFHYTLSLACESERLKPGSGIVKLQKLKRPAGEQELFLNHPKISAEFAYEHRDQFYSPNLIEIVKYHHEKHDGSGFPEGIQYHSLSDFELILTFSDHLVAFPETLYVRGDLKKALFEESTKTGKIVEESRLPIKELLGKWNSFLHWLLEDKVMESA